MSWSPIDLPMAPAPASATPIYLDKGGIIAGGGGASDQRLNKLGNRYGIAVTMPPMKSPKVGRQWVSRLIQAQTRGARMRWPLNGFDPGAPGTILVNGAAQAGSTLVVDSGTPNYVAREGQFFSVLSGVERYMQMVAAETIFNNSGQASIPLPDPLRVQFADNAICEFGVPMLEGFVQGDSRQWEYAIANFTGLSFEIHERA